MAKLVRKNQKIFSETSSDNGQYGSGLLGTKVLSDDPDVLQQLAAWLGGWDAAVLGGQNLPPMEEMNAVQYVITRQLAYLFEQGIPEYEVGTTYYQKSIVVEAGTYNLYGSLTDSNTGNALTDTTNWEFLGNLETSFNTLQQNNFVLPATTNNSFTSSDAVNPMGFLFDDGKPRYGKQQYIFAGLKAIEDKDNFPMYDNNGLQGFHPIDAKTGKVVLEAAFYGNWTFEGATNDLRMAIWTATPGDYFIFTEVFEKVVVLSRIDNSNNRNTDNVVYLDGFTVGDPTGGTDTTNDLDQQGSDVIQDQGYAVNQTQELDLNSPSQGIHTVKIENGTDGAVNTYLMINGIELVNELNASTQEIMITEHTRNIQGKEVLVSEKTGSDCLNIKDGIVGSKGGFVGWWVDKDGNYQSEKQEPETYEETGVAEYNAASSDSISGLTDSSKFYDNSQPNLIRVYKTSDPDKQLLLAPSAAPDVNNLTLANDYDGVADTTLFAGNKQFEPDGSTGVVIADQDGITVELYGKIGVNADHSNEEPLQRRIGWDGKLKKQVARDRLLHYKDYGNQKSDDFTSSSPTSTSDMAYTKEDGGSTLVAEDSYTQSNGGLFQASTSDFFVLTFYGTGLDLVVSPQTSAGACDNYDVYLDGILVLSLTSVNYREVKKICSDLPLGFHTLKIIRTAAAVQGIEFFNFITYLPKQPLLTENFHYDFYNYCLADFVTTSLPTLNLSTYNGAIDQGVIRKQAVTGFVYTGAGTWQYNTVNTTYVNGRGLYLTSGNDGAAQIEVYGSGYFRTWMNNSNTSDTQDISVDGVKIHDYTPATTNFCGIIYDTVGAELNTLGTEGLHNILVERDIFANSTYAFDAIDFHCPVLNLDQWRNNPFRDYFIDGQSVMDNRKFSIYDNRPVQRVIEIESTVADSSAVTTTIIPIASSGIEKGVYDVEAILTMVKVATDANDAGVYISKDSTEVRQASGGAYGSAQNALMFVTMKNLNVEERSGVDISVAASNNSKYQINTSSNKEPRISFTKISEDD